MNKNFVTFQFVPNIDAKSKEMRINLALYRTTSPTKGNEDMAVVDEYMTHHTNQRIEDATMALESIKAELKRKKKKRRERNRKR